MEHMAGIECTTVKKLEKLLLMTKDSSAHLQCVSSDWVIALAHIYAISLRFIVDKRSIATLALSGVEIEVLGWRGTGNALFQVAVVVRSSDGAIFYRSVLGLDVIIDIVPIVG